MKKIMIAALVVAAAFASQAASVKWTVKNIHEFGSSTQIASGSNYSIALFFSADSVVSSTFDTGSIVAGSDTLIGVYSPAGTGGLKSTGTSVDFDYSAGSYYYVALFNEKGTTSADAFTQYAVSSTLTGNPVATSPDVPLTLKWNASDASPSWTATSVPEPTSGLLLLLGMAGLALKRKHA